MSSLPSQGEIGNPPLPRLLLDLQRAHFTGELVLERGRARKQLLWHEGAPVAAESSLSGEALSALCLRRGLIDADAAERVRTTTRDRACPEAAVILGLQLVPAKVLFGLLKERIAICVAETVAWPDGRFSLDAQKQAPEDARAFQSDALMLVQRGLVTHWPPERLATALSSHYAEYARLGDVGSARLRGLGGDEQSILRLLALLDGKRTLEAVIGAVFGSPHAMSALWIADAQGWLDYAAAAPESTRDADTEAAPEIEIEITDAAAGKRARAGAEWARAKKAERIAGAGEEIAKEVLDLHQQLDELDHYAFLGVERNASPALIKKAYFRAAKRFHPDKLAALGLAAIREQAAEVFARFSEAHEVLGDPDRRTSYDDVLAGGGKTEGVDVARLTQAESFFRKGEVLVKMGDFRSASDMLRNAVELWPDESQYQALFGWTLFKKRPPENDAAREALERALELDPGNARAHQWFGLVLRALGQTSEAAESLARARKLDPSLS